MRCPAGHESAATDYCDVCGLVMPSGGSPAGTDGAGAAAPPPGTSCPNCGVAAPADALFCEACGYDFTTGSTPAPLAPPPGVASGQEVAGSPAPGLSGWVAEVWIDPDWYAAQEASDPLPSPGLPLVLPLRHTSLLVGRRSRSRGISPDIDLSSDTGISRRHAQLTSDGTRWWVEDLGSSNGTYVGPASGPLPTQPVVPGEKREVDADDRVYLGAWTRLIIRPAAPGEAG